MTYNITLTNGQNLVAIADGTADTSYSSLTLFGKNYAGYGPLLDENLIHILENFSFNTPPPNALQGQLWWDSSNKLLKLFKDTAWKVVSGPTPSPTAPVTDVVGDLWWDTINSQLNSYNGTSWITVGPAFTSDQGISGSIVATVFDGLGHPHTVVNLYVGDQIIGVISKDSSFSTVDIPGFTTILPGFNIATNFQYHGDSDNALSLGNVLATNYLRSDVISTTNHAFNVQTNDGLTVGLSQDLTFNVQGSAAQILSNTTGRDLELFVSVSGVSTLGLKLNTADGLVTVGGDPSVALGVATKRYVDNSLTTAASQWILANGNTPIVGNLAPMVNGVYDLGSNVNAFGTIYSTLFSGYAVDANTATIHTLEVINAPTVSTSATNKIYVDNVAASLNSNISASANTVTSAIVGNAPPGLTSLSTIAAAINNDVNYSTTIANQIAGLATASNAQLTGTPVAPTVNSADVSNKIATTAFVATAITNEAATITSGFAPINNATFTGITSAVSPFTGDVSTKVATTSFVANAISIDRIAISSNPAFTGTLSIDNIVARQGIEIVSGGLTTTTNNFLNIGTSTNRFSTVWANTFSGSAASAEYADLAENYIADATYGPGTVLDFGGSAEVTLSSSDMSSQVAGVVSTNPAYLMNSGCNGTFAVALALQGRVPVKVTGTITKGALLVSAGNGYARAEINPKPGTIIGKAINNFSGESGIIEVAVGRF